MTTIRIATKEEIRSLSRKLLRLLENREGQIYQENVAKFGIPDEYVKKTFSEEEMLEAATTAQAVFYLALEGREIVGFAEAVKQDENTVELDRIIVFPESTRKGIGTELLEKAIIDQKQRGCTIMVVRAGKEETHARKFYEKNGFEQQSEAEVETPWGRKVSLVTYKLDLKKN